MSECVEGADPKAIATLYALGVFYIFIGFAILVDEYFIPAVDSIAEELKLSPVISLLDLSVWGKYYIQDVAGATLLAMGGSAPELFTSLAGTFLRTTVGIGSIVSYTAVAVG